LPNLLTIARNAGGGQLLFRWRRISPVSTPPVRRIKAMCRSQCLSPPSPSHSTEAAGDTRNFLGEQSPPTPRPFRMAAQRRIQPARRGRELTRSSIRSGSSPWQAPRQYSGHSRRWTSPCSPHRRHLPCRRIPCRPFRTKATLRPLDRHKSTPEEK